MLRRKALMARQRSIRLWVRTSKTISRHWDQYVLARRQLPRLRLIMEKTVSTCQRWPYVGLSKLVAIRRRQRVGGSFEVGRPCSGGMMLSIPNSSRRNTWLASES